MRRKLLYLLLIAVWAAAAAWTAQRPVAHYLSDLRSQVAIDQGEPQGNGNLLGIQPELFTPDYQSPARLRLKLAGYLAEARRRGLLGERTLVVLPEHIGTWLLIAGEKPQVYTLEDSQQAQRWMAWSNPLRFARAWLPATDRNRPSAALLRMKARDMAEQYQRVFGSLAREFHVTLVAGSIVLPSPEIVDNRLVTGSGPLQNTSVVFASDGRLLPPLHRHAYYPEDRPSADDHLPDEGRPASAQRPADDRSTAAAERYATPAGVVQIRLSGEPLTALDPEALLVLPLAQDALPDPRTPPRAALALAPQGKLWGKPLQGHSRWYRAGASGVLDERGARLLNLWL